MGAKFTVVTSPVVRSVIESLRSQIRNGTLAAGSQLPSELDLAATLSVSRGTVRRAIEILVENGEVARRPHSRPIVQGTVHQEDTALGTDVHVWISRKIADMAALQMLRGVSQSLAGSGRRLIVREPTKFVREVVECEERQFLVDLLEDDSARGAIIERDPFRSNSDLFQRLIRRGKHLVFVDSPPPAGIEADHVGTANTTAARECVQHLIDLGHTNIACVIDTEIPRPIQDRVKGYWRAMQHAGLNEQAHCIVGNALEGPTRTLSIGGAFARNLSSNPLYASLAQRIVAEILSMDPMPTALFVAYDVLAYWVCAYLEGSGIQIPEQMSVVGFDWQSRPGEDVLDLLTTARQDFEGFGRHAVDLLLDRFDNGGTSTPRHVLLDAPLVVRSTTAAQLTLPSYASAGNSSDAGVLPYS